MNIYVDRNAALMQVVTTTTLTQYKTIKFYLARGDFRSGVLMYSCPPSQNIIFPFVFSTNNIADVFLVGVDYQGAEILVEKAPLFKNTEGGNMTMMFEAEKVREQRRRALMLKPAHVILYLLQNGTRCGCYDDAFGTANKSCTNCGGSGIVEAFIGFRTVMKIQDTVIVTSNLGDRGTAIVKQINGCWALPFPYMSNNDMIETSSGEIYKIQKVLDDYVDGTTVMVSQDFNLIAIQDYQRFKLSKTKLIIPNEGTNSAIKPLTDSMPDQVPGKFSGKYL